MIPISWRTAFHHRGTQLSDLEAGLTLCSRPGTFSSGPGLEPELSPLVLGFFISTMEDGLTWLALGSLPGLTFSDEMPNCVFINPCPDDMHISLGASMTSEGDKIITEDISRQRVSWRPSSPSWNQSLKIKRGLGAGGSRGCSVHQRVFRSIPGLCLLRPSNILPSPSCDNQKRLQHWQMCPGGGG